MNPNVVKHLMNGRTESTEGRLYVIFIDLTSQVARVHIERCRNVAQYEGVASPPHTFYVGKFPALESAEWTAEWVTRGRSFKIRHCAECLP